MKTTTKQLDHAAAMLQKYAHRWGAEPSLRMLDWVDTIETIRREHRSEYVAWLAARGYHANCDAYDFLA